jgi:hypothetical protein
MRQANFRGNVFEFLEAGGKDNAEACLPCLPAGRRQAGAEITEARGELCGDDLTLGRWGARGGMSRLGADFAVFVIQDLGDC